MELPERQTFITHLGVGIDGTSQLPKLNPKLTTYAQNSLNRPDRDEVLIARVRSLRYQEATQHPREVGQPEDQFRSVFLCQQPSGYLS